MPARAPLDDDRLETLDAYGRYAGLGLQFVVAMCLLGAAGYWADGKLGSYPLLLILGLFLGAGGSFISLLKAVPPVSSRSSSKERDDDPAS